MAYVAPTIRSVGDAVTAADYNIMANDVIDHESRLTQIKRLGYQEHTTNYTTASTTFAGASDIFGTNITFTADGTSAYRFIFYCSRAATGGINRAVYVSLNISGTQTGRAILAFGGASTVENTGYYDRVIVPTAGSKTVNFRGIHDVGACTLSGGDGTANNFLPMYMAVFGPALT